MEELAVKRHRAKVTEVRLRLQSTTVPSDALPRGAQGERLVLPTSVRIVLRDVGLRIEMIALDPEEWCSQYYEEPDFDDENPPIIVLNLDCGEILRLTIGGFQNYYPTAVLAFNDPLEVVDSLTMTFVSTDPNNSEYAIRALTKMLREGFDVTVEEFRQESKMDSGDIPF